MHDKFVSHIFIFLVLFNGITMECSLGTQCILKAFTLCRSFLRFNEIKFQTCNTTSSDTIIFLRPLFPILVDESLNLTDISIYVENGTNSKSILIRHNTFSYILLNVNGFNYKTNIKYPLFVDLPNYRQFRLYDSNFDFYIDNKLVNHCDQSLYTIEKFYFPFEQISALSFYFRVKLSRICPLYFKNVNITYFEVIRMQYSFIKNNVLLFYKINQTIDIKSMILRFRFDNSQNLIVDHEILNPQVFYYLKILDIGGHVYSIDSNLFTKFRYIELVLIRVTNLHYLISKGIKWISSINQDLKLDLDDKNKSKLFLNRKVILYFSLESLGTIFDDENFCLFKDFPHSQLIFPVVYDSITIQYNNNCTCSHFWLMKYYYLYDLSGIDDYLNTYFYDRIIMDHSFVNQTLCNNTSNLNQCEFVKKFELCNITTIAELHYNSFYGKSKDTIVLVDFIFEVCLLPTACITGISFNYLIIKTIVDKRNRKNLSAKQYKFMLYMTVFNLIYCFINIFNLIGECRFEYGLFCSSIKGTIISIIYFPVVYGILGNFLILGSNFSYIAFAINRYLLIGKNHHRYFVKFSKIDTKKYFRVMIMISFIMSPSRYLSYINYSEIKETYQPKEYPYYYQYTTQVYLPAGKLEFLKIFTGYNFISDLLNYVIFFVFNLIMDILLIRKLKDTLNNRKLTGKNKINSKQKDETSAKGLKMIIINSALNFFLRIPHVLQVANNIYITFWTDDLGLQLRINQNEYINFCDQLRLCDTVFVISNFLYILNLNFNFLIFYNFDKKFRESYDNLKSKK